MEDIDILLPTANESTATEYSFHLDEEIKSPEYYRALVEVMVSAKQDDNIILYINSPGGDAYGMKSILSAMSLCQCNIGGFLIGDASSAASAIFLNCDYFYISDHATMMIHEGFLQSGGTPSNLAKHVTSVMSNINKFIDDTYGVFLTLDEIEKVKTAGDVYLNADEIKERLDVLIEHRALLAEEQEELEQTVH